MWCKVGVVIAMMLDLNISLRSYFEDDMYFACGGCMCLRISLGTIAKIYGSYKSLLMDLCLVYLCVLNSKNKIRKLEMMCN